MGPETARNFELGRQITEETLVTAREAREAFRARLSGLLEAEGTVICLPTSPSIAPLLESGAEALAEQRLRVHSLTCSAGLSGFPQVSLPLAEVDGCPVGLSLLARAGQDMMLLGFAESFAASPDALEA